MNSRTRRIQWMPAVGLVVVLLVAACSEFDLALAACNGVAGFRFETAGGIAGRVLPSERIDVDRSYEHFGLVKHSGTGSCWGGDGSNITSIEFRDWSDGASLEKMKIASLERLDALSSAGNRSSLLIDQANVFGVAFDVGLVCSTAHVFSEQGVIVVQASDFDDIEAIVRSIESGL